MSSDRPAVSDLSAHEKLPRQATLLDDALERPAPDLGMVWHDHGPSALWRLFPHHDMTPGLPRLCEPVRLKNFADFAR